MRDYVRVRDMRACVRMRVCACVRVCVMHVYKGPVGCNATRSEAHNDSIDKKEGWRKEGGRDRREGGEGGRGGGGGMEGGWKRRKRGQEKPRGGEGGSRGEEVEEEEIGSEADGSSGLPTNARILEVVNPPGGGGGEGRRREGEWRE